MRACVFFFFFSVCDVMCVSDGVGCGLVLNFGSVLGLLFLLGVDEFVGVFICFVICCVGLKLESCVVDVEQIALEQRREEREISVGCLVLPLVVLPSRVRVLERVVSEQGITGAVI